jgi:hypothetical protein
VTNPLTPQLSCTVQQSQLIAVDFYMNGNSAVIAGLLPNGNFYKGAIILLDLSNPSSPSIVGSFSTPSTRDAPRAIAGTSTTAFAAIVPENGTSCSLSILDISNPSAPRQIGGIADVGSVQTMSMSQDGHSLYIGANGSWSIVDVSNPAAPVMKSTVAATGLISGFATSGTYLFLTSGQNLLVYDVQDPTNPVQIRSYKSPGIATTVKVAGSVIYLADSAAGINILSLPDADPPLVQFATPSASGSFASQGTMVDISGTASDSAGLVNGTVSQVTWSNSRGGGGVATGTTIWSATNIKLAAGENLITISATDNAGNVGTANLAVTFSPPDTVAPAVNITAPSSKGFFQTASIAVDLRGMAVDNVGVSSVVWSNARGGSGAAIGTAAWTVAGIPLQPGPNPITLTATDAAGNTGSATVNISYQPPDSTPPVVKIQFPTLAASLETNFATVNLSGTASDDSGAVGAVTWSSDQGGHGTCSGAAIWSVNSVPLKPGPNHLTVTALDESGNATSDFLVVNYTPLPALDFAPLAGSYYGLTQAADAAVLPDGYAGFRVARMGSFSGSVGFGNAVYALIGKLAADGTFTKTILRGRLRPLVVTLRLGADGIFGTISDGTESIGIVAVAAAHGTALAPVAQKGSYTFLIHPMSAGDTIPPGIGYGRLTVDSMGMVRLVGALPDATAFSQAAPISAAGVWQMFVKPAGVGRISGPLVFRSLDGTDLDGTLDWSMPANKRATRYPSGFATQAGLDGSVYLAPPLQAQIFPAGPASLTIEAGKISVVPATKSLNVDTGNLIHILTNERFSMSLAGPTGLFSGTFVDTAKTVRTFHGAVLQKQGIGGGVFIGSRATGSVLLQR